MRELQAVIEREKAQIGVLITMRKPTAPMIREAAGAGVYESPWGKHPRLQILTIEELLQGKRVDYVTAKDANVTLKAAPKVKSQPIATMALPLLDS